MPTLESFISPNYFNSETATTPLYAGMLAGSTYRPPTFNGVSFSTSTDPGGLFGWLIYARTEESTPTKGATTDTYLVYTTPSELVNDLNALSGVTYCLLTTAPDQGGTYGFFKASGNAISGLTTGGLDFLYALSYLAYGGVLVIAGSTAGLNNYEIATNNLFDVLIGQNGNTAEVSHVEKTPHIIGIFASNNSGLGFTAINYDALFSSSSYVSGSSYASRFFNISGQNNRQIQPTTLKEGSNFEYSLSMVSDVAGSFVRSKNNNNLYYTVAGMNNSSVLNGDVNGIVDWNNVTFKDIYKKNRVNFYTTSANLDFLGLDLVGVTASTSSAYTSSNRVGNSKIKLDIEKNVKNILLKYVFQINDANTRAAITSEINLYILSLSEYLDTNYTEIYCDSSNNTDYASTINAKVIVKPLVASDAFVITVTTT